MKFQLDFKCLFLTGLKRFMVLRKEYLASNHSNEMISKVFMYEFEGNCLSQILQIDSEDID